MCAQRLPRELRLLLYGRSHKEVDLSGAHYEMIRAMTCSDSLPPTGELRGWLRDAWDCLPEVSPNMVKEEAKMLPIRVINSGAARALQHLAACCLSLPPWIEAFAYDLEAARAVFTAHVRKEVRPQVEAIAKNQHFFAAEAIEAIFMQLFLREVRKWTDTPSIIWLHDGLWISREVDNQVLYAAEKQVKKILFHQSSLSHSLFVITDLQEAWSTLAATCPPPPYPPLLAPCPRRTKRGWKIKGLSKQFPVARFSHRLAAKRKLTTYLERIGKRARRSSD